MYGFFFILNTENRRSSEKVFAVCYAVSTFRFSTFLLPPLPPSLLSNKLELLHSYDLDSQEVRAATLIMSYYKKTTEQVSSWGSPSDSFIL